MKQQSINAILSRVINPALRNDLSLLINNPEKNVVVMAEGYGHCINCALFVMTVDNGYYSYKKDSEANNDLGCILHLFGNRVEHPNPVNIIKRETTIALN